MRRLGWLLSLPMSAIVHGACVLTLVCLVYRGLGVPVLFVDLTTDLQLASSALPSADDRGTAASTRLRSGQSPGRPRGSAEPGTPRAPSSRDALSTVSSAPSNAGPAPAPNDERSEGGGPSPEPSVRIQERTEADTLRTTPLGVTAGGQTGIEGRTSPRPTGHDAETAEGPGRRGSENTRPAGRGTAGGSDSGPPRGRGSLPGDASAPHAAGHGGGGSALVARGNGEDGSALVARGAGEGGAGAEYGPYLRLWRTRIHENLRYPLAARRRSLTGTVQIEIVIEPSGAVGAVKVVESSSHEILDEAALESVKRLSPLPFPPHLAPRAIRARLPVVFEIR